MAFAISLLLAGAAGVALVLFALRDNVQFFRSPSDLVENPVPPGQSFRIGGLVEQGSLVREEGLSVRFIVTDGKHEVPVLYTGVLPDLFREGQGVIAVGQRNASGLFEAQEVLAKHDENYMPPEVVDALKRAGRWEEGGPVPGS
jgi:cytochrome c-type biogenesis protein CcmE